MNFTIRSVLFIDLKSLPENVQTQVLKQANGSRDSFNYWSELSPSNSFWNEICNLKCLEEYFEDQKANNNFKGSFEEFIEKYNLLLDKHLIDNNVPLDNVTNIIIEGY